MQFLSEHLILALGSAAAAVGIYLGRSYYVRCNEAVLSWGERKNIQTILWMLFALFYVLCYLTKPAYYTSYLGGVTGDNYRYVANGVGPCTFTAQHLYFPVVPGTLFHLLIKWGIFHENAPMFLEKAFPFFSLPSRLLALAGLGAFYALLRRRHSGFESLLGTAFLATTFGYWFWPLQSNAVGFVVPLVVVALYLSALAWDKGTPGTFALAATAVAFCFFTHISSAYLVGAMGAATVVLGFRRAYRGKARSALNVIVYVLTALVWVGVFFSYLKHQYGVHSLSEYVALLSDYSDQGRFSFAHFFEFFAKTALGVNSVLLFGFINKGGESLMERAVIMVQLGTVLFLLISTVAHWNKIKTRFSDPALMIPLVGFFGCLLGFAIRKTWFQYCSVITGVTAFLFVSLILAPETPQGRTRNGLGLLLLILGNLLTNGLSSRNVFAERQLRSSDVYRTYSVIHALTSGESAVFISPWRGYPYNFSGMTNYYQARRGVAEHIQWVENGTKEELTPISKSAGSIFVDEDTRSETAANIPPNFVKKQVIALPDFPHVSWWVRAKPAS